MMEKIHNWLCDDEFKNYLIWLNDLYSEKLLWQDYYKNDRPVWRANLSGELFGAMYMPYSDVFLNCEEDYSGYEPLIGPTGEKRSGNRNLCIKQYMFESGSSYSLGGLLL